jgi:hypothetical protein
LVARAGDAQFIHDWSPWLTCAIRQLHFPWFLPMMTPITIVIGFLWLGVIILWPDIKAWAIPSNLPQSNERIHLRFEYRPPFVQITPVSDASRRVYVRLFPECADPVENCSGHLTAIYRRVDNKWEPTDFNEAWPLTWANLGPIPVTVQPRIGPYLDVFYIGSDAQRIVPCIQLQGAPLRMVSPKLTPMFQSRNECFRFDVQVTASAPISLRVQLGVRWEQPIVEVLPNENCN